ncbi:trihelix transcription factor ASR3-like [Melia azedarach]|uniref:Trihelix transcription factor ASR3-like n=1 Tax=Melia azedarach TaxID=155640 RepID=A0ACC1WTT7_MELAZ|nr:trihelix transcription factor ASR3-like [Melia azedarach]
MHLVMADQGGNSNTTVMSEYRKGNWTVGETMVLIEAKQMDDERRMKRSSGDTSEGRGKPAELRWKWVEDYCWRKGCLRSQNQCNDKWDNLMRDYKKVRDYERKVAEKPGEVSYWKMEKNERKDKNLPSNMLLQIYEALVEVVEKKGAGQRVSAAGTGAGGSFMVERPIGMVQPPPAVAVASLPTMLQHHHHHQLSAATQMLPLPLPPSSSQQPPPPPQSLQQPPPGLPLPYSQPPTVDSDTSEYSDSSPAKRRRRGGNGNQGTSAGTASGSSSHELGTAISKSASIIAEALQACEEREEKRHRDLVSLHERRLKIEESKTEINRQGINGLVDAINKLANSILALASNNKNQHSAPKS